MMKKLFFGFAFFLASFAIQSLESPSLKAQQVPILEMFHGAECPHCHEQRAWLPKLEAMYPGLDVQMHEVWHDQENAALMKKRLAEIGATSSSVPTSIIQDEVVVGFSPTNILRLMQKHYGEPEPINEADFELKKDTEKSFPLWLIAVAVILIGAVFWTSRGPKK